MEIDYCGAAIAVNINTEENFIGTLYPVEMNNKYAFTLYTDEDGHWGILRESDGTIPIIEKELHNILLKKLKWQLQYAA